RQPRRTRLLPLSPVRLPLQKASSAPKDGTPPMRHVDPTNRASLPPSGLGLSCLPCLSRISRGASKGPTYKHPKKQKLPKLPLAPCVWPPLPVPIREGTVAIRVTSSPRVFL